MKVLVSNGKFQQFASDGTLAVGYKVYSKAAGTATDIATYSNYLCTVANTNPVVLDSRGEASIYVNAATDLYFTTPTGDTGTYIWKAEYVGYQEGVPPLLATVTPGTTHNNYVGAVSPVVASLSDQQIIIMTPDVTNVTTLTSTTFTGTGINDATFTGPYTGSTTGAVFSVVIDGVEFHGTGLDDATWGGTPLSGHVYTVIISTAAATDKFQWRKDGGAWSAEIAMTGAAQTLTDGVTITFAATTGHTATEYWNNINTFKWRIDAGAWTEGVAITADTTTPQSLSDGISISFAQKLDHTLTDIWALEVETPVKFNFCALGNKIVYKNVDGSLKALDAGDMVLGIPATFVYSLSQDCYILNNPSLPVLVNQKPYRERINLIGEYTVTDDDIGKLISCSGTFALIWPACSTLANHWWWVRNSGSGTITLTADGTEVFKYSALVAGATTLILYPGQEVMISTNGVNFMVAGYIMGGLVKTTYLTSGTSHTTQATTRSIIVRLQAGGGGGGGVAAASGNNYVAGGGGSGSYAEKTFSVSPSTAYTYAIGAAGAAGSNLGGNGGGGGNTTFTVGGTTVTAYGGGGGDGSGAGGGEVFEPGGAGGIVATNGDFNTLGKGGDYGLGVTAIVYVGGRGGDSIHGSGGAAKSGSGGGAGNAATGYGAGGGGAAAPDTYGGFAGGAGTAGFIVVEEYS